MRCSLARRLPWGTVPSSTSATGIDLMADTAPLSLCAREPHVPADRLVAEMVPPPRFDSVRFATYLPDPDQPSQTEAVRVLEGFAAGLDGDPAGGAKRSFLGFGKAARKAKAPAGPAASIWTAATASARPTCSPPCGTPLPPSPSARPSAPSWS